MVVFLFELVLAVGIADFLTGLAHWWEDTYGNPHWPLLGKYVVQPNLAHHQRPRELAAANYWQLTWVSWAVAASIIVPFWVVLNFHPTLFIASILIATQANQVHAWAHRTDRENGRVIRWLQSTGVIQSRRHHGQHHRPPYVGSYCILTDYLNPLLDSIEFWQRLERALYWGCRLPILRGSKIRDGL
jgi:hypothetical protein